MASRQHLPIFPLPDLVLFPHTLLPLHIFEPRYRAMTADCLGRDRRLAIVGLKPGYEPDYHGRPAVYPVAGVGRIVQCERLASGRFNMVLRGEGRVRIARELPTDTLYRIVEAEEMPEVGAERETVPPMVELARKTCRHILHAVKRATPEMEAALGEQVAPAVLCDQIASALVPVPEARQALLEEADVERRLRRLLTELSTLLKQLKDG
ncbi:MAG TPA: LON peptidase substrate-binding domain-containing protein [Methylomirabilota bacterium]|nr:LON peptidase substrate-binding domain-containing protein [Methylomirabilota bacterium]